MKSKAEKLQRLEEIYSELYDLANSFAMESEGVIGGELHESANRINNAIRMCNKGVTAEDSDKQIAEWCSKQPFPMDPQMVKQLQFLGRPNQ